MARTRCYPPEDNALSLARAPPFVVEIPLSLLWFHSAASRTYGTTRRDEAGLPSIARAPISRGAVVPLVATDVQLPSHASLHFPVARTHGKISRCERARRLHRRDDDNNSHQLLIHNCSLRTSHYILLARSRPNWLNPLSPLASRTRSSSVKGLLCNSNRTCLRPR